MKTQKSYTIEENVYAAFDSLTTERNINKSSFIEDCIKKFLKKNDMDFVDKLYSLKTNPDHIVTVLSQDLTYYILDDGSKIQKILFMQIFKECESVNPNEFFNKSIPIFENLAEKIKNIDESKVDDFSKSSTKYIEDLIEQSHRYFSGSNIKVPTRENIDKLDQINNNFKSGKILDIKDICYNLVDLMKLDFIPSSKEHSLQYLLIDILTKKKDNWWKESKEKEFADKCHF